MGGVVGHILILYIFALYQKIYKNILKVIHSFLKMRCACGGCYSTNKYFLERHLYTKRHKYYFKMVNEMRGISIIKNNQIAIINELKYKFKNTKEYKRNQ
jgi:hypothetical protein